MFSIVQISTVVLSRTRAARTSLFKGAENQKSKQALLANRTGFLSEECPLGRRLVSPKSPVRSTRIALKRPETRHDFVLNQGLS